MLMCLLLGCELECFDCSIDVYVSCLCYKLVEVLGVVLCIELVCGLGYLLLVGVV